MQNFFKNMKLTFLLSLSWLMIFAIPASALAEDYPHGPTAADLLYIEQLNQRYGTATTATPPPTGTVYAAAEYDQLYGAYLNWQGYTGIMTQMAQAMSSYAPNTKMIFVVENASQQSSATSTLSAAGVDMDRVEFTTHALSSVWMRDYAARAIFVDGVASMMDHEYNRNRPDDDDWPEDYATEVGMPYYALTRPRHRQHP